MDSKHTPPVRYEGPGLVDLQLNGYRGFDFNGPPERWSAKTLCEVKAALNRRGVVQALPTFITADVEQTVARCRRYAELVEEKPELEGTFPGLHIEGPFISPDDGPRGAHPREHCRTPKEIPDLLSRMREASGDRILLLTLAPELPGARALIETASLQGIRVSIGHTQASTETIRDAIAAGAVMSTHLGNGCHPTLPRLDNYLEVQLAADDLHAGFIADGHHLPFSTLKNFIRAKTYERTILVTDATAGADATPGEYTLGPATIVASDDGRVIQPGSTARLAGSALTLDLAVMNVCTYCKVPFDEAWRMASSRPASLMGLSEPGPVAVEITESGFNNR